MNLEPTIQAGFLIRGRVQGVGFRWWAAKLATRYHLVGTVRNKAQDVVEIEVRGLAEDIGRFKACLHEGPVAARVTEVSCFDSTHLLPEDFRILP